MTFLIGEQSLVLAGSDGAVDVWFRLPSETGGDGFALVKAHALEPHAGAVSGLAASERGKLLLSADVAGRVWLRHATSERTLAKLAAPQGAVEALALAPRDDGVLAFSRRQESLRILSWTVDQPHAETTLRTVFGPVWYEGYAAPGFTWQSSSGGDGFEPKLSLVPLIFGTLKATLYAMAFALPIALGAAIYTAEFLHRRIRAAVKPAIEMMASLPSVVLGFIAALVLAPLVESWVAAVILAFVALPLSLAAAAFLWQLLPAARARRLGGVPKFVLIGGVVGLGLWLAAALGPWFERLVFAGDVKAWLEGDIGSAVPFLVLLLFVPSYLAIALGTRRAAGDALAAMTRPLGRAGLAAIDLARWLAELAAALLLAWLMAAALAALGFDARGSLVEGYAQRNALVVGFAMGFAVIPIVYTIAEDALAAVPEHLRAASLGCGATPWQTAIRIVLPTALSGVFAAVMIGLGRAVGETMIVVMAAGNTPVMEWNPFGGLRTLSANIAVELPEAVRDSTLYRLLFLSALVLFAITFAVNTLAEIVRLRFRKRAASL
ncbi:MAG: ABC transporter permease subunit [Alphaproteobacteria bacterium]|nr:ABC transporter permease subunit [Alphaproteobacteria bacterium]